MKSSAISFIVSIVALSGLCAAIEWFFYKDYPQMKLQSGFLLLGVFAVITAGIHFLLLKSAEGSPQGFIRAFMAGSGIRLLLLLGTLVVFLALTTENKKSLILHFLFYYVIFSVFEFIQLQAGLKKVK